MARVFTDVCLVSSDGDRHMAHRIVLAEASPVLQTILLQNGEINALIGLPDVSSQALSKCLDVIYRGSADFSDTNIAELLDAADLLELPVVWRAFEEFACRSLSDDNVSYFEAVAKLYEMERLAKAVENYIETSFLSFEDASLARLGLDTVIGLLKRDEFPVPVSETSLFCFVIKWLKATGHVSDSSLVLLLLQEIRWPLVAAGAILQCLPYVTIFGDEFLFQTLIDTLKRLVTPCVSDGLFLPPARRLKVVPSISASSGAVTTMEDGDETDKLEELNSKLLLDIDANLKCCGTYSSHLFPSVCRSDLCTY